jgi:hypothetical protein
MIKFSRCFAIAIVLLLTGCKYAFVDKLKIEAQLKLLTSLGSNSVEVRRTVNDVFGESSFAFDGLTKLTEEGWRAKGIRSGDDVQKLEGSHFFTYKLGSHIFLHINLAHIFLYI